MDPDWTLAGECCKVVVAGDYPPVGGRGVTTPHRQLTACPPGHGGFSFVRQRYRKRVVDDYDAMNT